MIVGFTAVDAQGLTAPPFFLSFCVTVLTTYIADKTQQRGFMLIFLTIMGGVGYLMLALAKSVGARYTGVFLAACGIFPAIANILPWVLSRFCTVSFTFTNVATDNQGNDTRRGTAIVILNMIGQCGPVLGTRLYPASEAPYYVKGQSVCAAFMFFTTLLVIGLRTLLAWENKQLDRNYGTLEEQDDRKRASMTGSSLVEKQVGVENYGPRFRYVL
jgi:MFS family permease